MHIGFIGSIGPAATEFYYRGLVRAIVCDLVGFDYAGLSSDFDGATTTGFDASQVVAAG